MITTVPTADRQKATVLVRIGFNELDPRILPDMGVKVTFLREAAEAAAPAARPVALVPKSAVRADERQPATCSSCTRTRSSAAPSRPAAPTATASRSPAGLTAGDRVVVSPPAELGRRRAPIVIK